MEKETKQRNRRGFLYGAAASLSALVLWRFGKKVAKPEEEPKLETPVKMLTEDGQLVEVDPRYLNGSSRMIKPDEIHTWVKHKS